MLKPCAGERQAGRVRDAVHGPTALRTFDRDLAVRHRWATVVVVALVGLAVLPCSVVVVVLAEGGVVPIWLKALIMFWA